MSLAVNASNNEVRLDKDSADWIGACINVKPPRKVTGVEVAQEYKNLLSDYTKKSQTLAELEKGKTINNAPEKPYQDPNWQPQTWAEAIALAKQEALQEIEARDNAQKAQAQACFK